MSFKEDRYTGDRRKRIKIVETCIYAAMDIHHLFSSEIWDDKILTRRTTYYKNEYSNQHAAIDIVK